MPDDPEHKTTPKEAHDPDWRLGFLAWLDGKPRDETQSAGWLRGWDDGRTHRA